MYSLLSLQLLVSDMVWEYPEISVFSHHASVFRIGKNPITPVLFAQTVTLCVRSVLIGWPTLHFLARGEVAKREHVSREKYGTQNKSLQSSTLDTHCCSPSINNTTQNSLSFKCGDNCFRAVSLILIQVDRGYSRMSWLIVSLNYLKTAMQTHTGGFTYS